jgi:hypothetical protein
MAHNNNLKDRTHPQSMRKALIQVRAISLARRMLPHTPAEAETATAVRPRARQAAVTDCTPAKNSTQSMSFAHHTQLHSNGSTNAAWSRACDWLILVLK